MPPTAQDLSLLIHPLVPDSIAHNNKVRPVALHTHFPNSPSSPGPFPSTLTLKLTPIPQHRPSPTSAPYPPSSSALLPASSASSPPTASSSIFSGYPLSHYSSTFYSQRVSRGDTSRVAAGVMSRAGRRTVVRERGRGGMCGLGEGC